MHKQPTNLKKAEFWRKLDFQKNKTKFKLWQQAEEQKKPKSLRKST